MTEAEWMSAEHPYDMIYHKSCRDDRKRRLLSCACARLLLDLIPADPFPSAIAFSERWADGEFDNDEWKAIRKTMRTSGRGLQSEPACDARDAIFATTEKEFMLFKMTIEYAGYARAATDRNRWEELHAEFVSREVELVREIFPNPFRPVNVAPGWLMWNENTVPRLARAIYEEQAYDRLPILADALEEAGCDSRELLEHCRRADGHVRGCWAVDLLKEQ